ncbi:MAG: GNAT family N-acetyltransferase [Casimicrobiaceae bacterium]
MPLTSIRPAVLEDAAAIAQVRVDSWRTTYRGVMPDAYLDAMSVEQSTALWHRVLGSAPNRTHTFVAETAGVITGFGSGLMLSEPKHDLDAELTAVYIRPAQQRTGIGHRLVGAVATAQRALGATGLLAWVLAANRRARAFYASLGAELLIEQPYQWDGMDLVETGYGWRDLDALITACGPIVMTQH